MPDTTNTKKRSRDSQDTLGFSALSGVRPMIETMPLSRAPEAYARMMRAEARFRMVLTMAEQHYLSRDPVTTQCEAAIRSTSHLPVLKLVCYSARSE